MFNLPLDLDRKIKEGLNDLKSVRNDLRDIKSLLEEIRDNTAENAHGPTGPHLRFEHGNLEDSDSKTFINEYFNRTR